MQLIGIQELIDTKLKSLVKSMAENEAKKYSNYFIFLLFQKKKQALMPTIF